MHLLWSQLPPILGPTIVITLPPPLHPPLIAVLDGVHSLRHPGGLSEAVPGRRSVSRFPAPVAPALAALRCPAWSYPCPLLSSTLLNQMLLSTLSCPSMIRKVVTMVTSLPPSSNSANYSVNCVGRGLTLTNVECPIHGSTEIMSLTK